MGLFGPKYFSKNESKRSAALEALTEQQRIELLSADLSGYSKNIFDQYALRREILSHISDQRFLASILAACCNGQADNGYRSIAAGKLTDPKYISAAYLAIRKPDDRIDVLDMVTDRALLAAVALNKEKTRSDVEQIHAVQKLKDENVAMLLCTDGVSPLYVREACIPLLGSSADEAAEKLLRQWEGGAQLSVGLIRFVAGRMPEDRIVRAIENCRNMPVSKKGINQFAAAVTDRGALVRLCAMSGGDSEILDQLNPDFDEFMIILSGTEHEHEWRHAAQRLSALKDDRVNKYLIDQLYGRGVRTDGNDSAEERHEDAMNLLNKRSGMDETAVAVRYGGEDAVKYYLDRLRLWRTRGDAFAQQTVRNTAEILRALYAAGIGRDAMADLAGKKLRDHYDYMPSPCEGDTHRDYPEVWFNV